jgi:hypothetical protein
MASHPSLGRNMITFTFVTFTFVLLREIFSEWSIILDFKRDAKGINKELSLH